MAVLKPKPMSPKVELSNLLTITQAAKVLGITRAAVSVAITRKRIKVHKIDHIRLIPRASLEHYKKTRKPGRPKKIKPRK